MVEVKKLFGIMLLSMCFYYLNAIMPWFILLWCIALSLFIGGIWYIITIESYHSTGMRWYKNIFGFILLLAGCLTTYQAIKATLETPRILDEAFHTATNYDDARQQALQENKYLIVDFGTLWCTSCKAIERKFFQNKQVLDALTNDFIIVKIDCSNDKDEACVRVQEQFANYIKGFPTLLVVQPQDQTVITHWGSELLELSLEEFISLANTAITRN
jgi:thiol:disulfide interchange protein